MAVEPLPVQRAGELDIRPADQRWLIRQLWSRAAVGIVAGPPKSAKSWLVLEMATCIAGNVPCLGRFPVEDPGPTLVYLAEDALPEVRARIASLCTHHHLDLDTLPLHVITASTLRLDLAGDQERLHATLAKLEPRLLVLDPLVRMHRLNENDASEMSGLLGFIRELQREHDVAVVLVHHSSKKRHGQQGLALRGSSDLHAFTDSAAYLVRRDDHVVLTSEHRSAKAPEPLGIRLVSGDNGEQAHLETVAVKGLGPAPELPLTERIIAALRDAGGPMTRQQLRDQLRVNNQRLGEALTELEQASRLVRSPGGWRLSSPGGTANSQLELL